MDKKFVSRIELYGHISVVYAFIMIMFLLPQKELILPVGCFTLILIFFIGVLIERAGEKKK